ncbi:MAG TPA: ribosome biogenesis GTPase Der [Polyangiaceae bacterium]
MTPIVAVVGRPNVGKSTLFNRMAGGKFAIVDDMPGVTRDRHEALAHFHGRNAVLIDTGGFDPQSLDPMQQGIIRQVRIAIDQADVVVCVFDGSLPPTEADREAVDLLRRSNKPVIYVANKVDTDARRADASELYALGLSDIIAISALHGRGTAELAAAVAARLPKVDDDEPADDDTPRVALVGRPNAGKSSWLNRLSGEERSLVDDRPGTTRDPVDSRVTIAGKEFVVVDTAGIRRRSRVEHGLELASVMRSIRAIERAQVVVVLCDASEGVAEQDARLLGLCIERRRAIVVGLNKIDVIPRNKRKKMVEDAQHALAFARWAPLIGLSAKTGAGYEELARSVVTASEEIHRRISTAELNRFFRDVLERQPPPTHGGRAPRIYYITQVESSPPLFMAWTNAPDSIKASYKRFVENQIRKAFGFQSIPVTVLYKERDRRA